MQMSPTIDQLATALAKAQAAMGHASKDGANPHFRSAYATLASVMEAIREPFAKNGLSFSQLVDSEGEAIFVTTILLHASGQYLASGRATARPVKNDPQGVGSVISYLKRYSLQAAVGIASADDDAEAASGRGDSGTAAKPAWNAKGGAK